ncbi:sugar phosphate isomerase/epimerase family protein [Streptomyces sp. NPDC059256]|uniref:sugar phosphate isomerase/epimerase family protein n=1 Tax=Streptomyces sp. NPDC059256 TaxID=3346794 RepID=UPI00367B674A
MKFAFSTLGVPGMPTADVAVLAADTGYQGVELRVAPDEPVHPGIEMPERAAVVKEFERAKVQILAVCGYTDLAAEADEAVALREIGELLWLARDLGAPYARVFPGGGDQDSSIADATAARLLGAAAETAAGAGVKLLLETHDSHPTGEDLSRVLGPVGHLHAGALWDVLHPWLAGEDPITTHGALAPFLGYVQVKDVASREDLTPIALGEGVVPLAECLATLTPQTWLSWEYEKRWHPQAANLPGLLVAGREHLEGLLSSLPAQPTFPTAK